MTDLFLLSQAQMRRIERYFPLSHGVARVDDRRIVSAIVFVIRNGLRWRDAPPEYGPHKTICNRFIRWSRLGVFNKIFAALARKGRNPERVMIDATHLKAHRTAASLLKKGLFPDVLDAPKAATTDGYWGGHRYFERIDPTQDPNRSQTIHFDEGDFLAHDVADFGFLDLVRLGVVAPDDTNVATSLSPTAAASDGNSTVQVTMASGDIYFHRYNHDNYGESDSDCTGWRLVHGPNYYGRFWPVLSGERGEYEIANGRSANVYLQSMADAANDGYFVPEQVWDRPDIACFTVGRPTGSAAPLNGAEGQYLRLAQSIDAGYNLDTPSVVKAKYRGAVPILGAAGECIYDAGASTDNGAAISFSPATRPPRRVGPGTATTARSARSTSVWTSLAARLPAERGFSSGTATAQPLRNGAGDSRPDS